VQLTLPPSQQAAGITAVIMADITVDIMADFGDPVLAGASEATEWYWLMTVTRSKSAESTSSVSVDADGYEFAIKP